MASLTSNRIAVLARSTLTQQRASITKLNLAKTLILTPNSTPFLTSRALSTSIAASNALKSSKVLNQATATSKVELGKYQEDIDVSFDFVFVQLLLLCFEWDESSHSLFPYVE